MNFHFSSKLIVNIGAILFIAPLIWGIGIGVLGAILQLPQVSAMSEFALVGFITGPIGILLMLIGSILGMFDKTPNSIPTQEKKSRRLKYGLVLLAITIIGSALYMSLSQ